MHPPYSVTPPATLFTQSVQSVHQNTDCSLHPKAMWSSLIVISPPSIKQVSSRLTSVNCPSVVTQMSPPRKRTLSCSAAYLPGVVCRRIPNDSVKQSHSVCKEDIDLFSGLYQQDSGPISVRARLPCFHRSGRYTQISREKHKVT